MSSLVGYISIQILILFLCDDALLILLTLYILVDRRNKIKNIVDLLDIKRNI